MCNPPFYADAAELYEHARLKSLEPFSVFSKCEIRVIARHVLDLKERCVLLAVKLDLLLALLRRV